MQPEGAAQGQSPAGALSARRYSEGVRRLAVAGNLEHQLSVGGRQ